MDPPSVSCDTSDFLLHCGSEVAPLAETLSYVIRAIKENKNFLSRGTRGARGTKGTREARRTRLTRGLRGLTGLMWLL